MGAKRANVSRQALDTSSRRGLFIVLRLRSSPGTYNPVRLSSGAECEQNIYSTGGKNISFYSPLNEEATGLHRIS